MSGGLYKDSQKKASRTSGEQIEQWLTEIIPQSHEDAIADSNIQTEPAASSRSPLRQQTQPLEDNRDPTYDIPSSAGPSTRLLQRQHVSITERLTDSHVDVDGGQNLDPQSIMMRTIQMKAQGQARLRDDSSAKRTDHHIHEHDHRDVVMDYAVELDGEEDHTSMTDVASTALDHDGSQSGITFHCTFCDRTFASSSSWRRHEIEQHIQPPTWLCQPATRNMQGALVCFFCDKEIEPQPCSHNKTKTCIAKGRSFKRKYQVKKHLMQDHNLDPQISERVVSCFKVESVVDTTNIDLTCYFCGYRGTSWRDRADHVGSHFRLSPCTKSEWDAQRDIALGLRAREARPT